MSFSFTILKVYDVLGIEVATLVNEESATGGAGSYGVEFSAIGGSASGGDAYTLASGIYFYQLRVYPAGGGDPSKIISFLRRPPDVRSFIAATFLDASQGVFM